MIISETRLEKQEKVAGLRINRDFVADFSVLSVADTIKLFGNSMVCFTTWELIKEILKNNGVADNNVTLDIPAKKALAESLGQKDAKRINEGINKLVSVDFLKQDTNNKHRYMVNPILVFKGRVAERFRAILSYYDNYTPNTEVVREQLAVKYRVDFSGFVEGVNNAIEEFAIKIGEDRDVVAYLKEISTRLRKEGAKKRFKQL